MARTTVSATERGLRLTTRLEERVRARLVPMFTKIVMRTPVETGRTRANWNVSYGTPNYTFTTRTDVSHVLSQIQAINEMPLDSMIYLSNGAPHIRLLEYGGYPNPPKHPTGKSVGGFSSQAPAGMVRVTLVEFRRSQ